MKKIGFACVFLASFISLALFFVVKPKHDNELFRLNIEALSSSEIIVGKLCAYDINCWCIYLNPYEEYQGQFVD